MALDWVAIRAEWEAGGPEITSRVLADKYGCSHTAIVKKSKDEKQEGGPWQKRLRDRVIDRAKEILATDGALSSDERQRVEEAATTVVNVSRTHRATVRKQSNLVDRLTDLLAKQLDKAEKNVWLKTADLVALSDLADRQSRALTRLVELERTMYGLDSPEGGEKSIGDVIDGARSNEERVRRFRELVGRADSRVAE